MTGDPGGVRSAASSRSAETTSRAGASAGAGGGDVRRAAPGSDDLERWIADHGPGLERHLVGMTGDPDEAKDVLQQVWITALRSPPDDGPESNVRGWLYRVATNAALDRLARRRRRRRALAGREEAVTPSGPAPPDAALDGLDDEARARVRLAVAALPRKQREAVWLRWIEGVGYEDIADRLETSRAAARANVYQGLRKLQQELDGLWSGERNG